MGMFANHADVHHPTGEFDLADCTACQGRGYTTYPVVVSTGEDAYEPCRFGCLPPEDRDGYYTDHEPEIDLGTDLMDAWYRSLQPVEEVDPFLILSQAAQKANLKPVRDLRPPRHPGSVSSDLDLMGLAEDDLHRPGDGLLVYPCTVPAYLAGVPISFEAGVLRVRYEYMGSFVTVRYGALEASFMRFAYSWDNDFGTDQVHS